MKTYFPILYSVCGGKSPQIFNNGPLMIKDWLGCFMLQWTGFSFSKETAATPTNATTHQQPILKKQKNKQYHTWQSAG